jgi:ribosome-associated toxin RatA of RatAB toxin-antitoxin module
MVNNWVPIVAVVTVIYALLFLLIVFDASLLYNLFKKLKGSWRVKPDDDQQITVTK